ncbi:patatin-like phospholipase family protein [Paraneptunicella aestuarii]|nr:patatin-like phospholipase family protein [Paraneptunicella aestuarii]
MSHLENISVKLGIVLGSGAARGWAHIGIIKELMSMGIKPHVVTGTSIGSLVGAALASGRMAELEEWVRGLTNWQVLGLLDWGLGKGGLVSGQRVFEKVADTLGGLTFADLEIPFGAVATNLQTGRETWLMEGELKAAIRCSCAIPGLMAPAYHNGQWLVDGATVNPIPVSMCRALGADFVIAIDLNSDKPHHRIARNGIKKVEPPVPEEVFEMPIVDSMAVAGHDMHEEKNPFAKLLSHSKEYLQQFSDKQHAEKAPGVFAVMSGCIDIMQDRITRSRLAGEPPDILLQPKVGRYGIMEFHRAEELIAEGQKCVQASKSILEYELEHFKDLEKEWEEG